MPPCNEDIEVGWIMTHIFWLEQDKWINKLLHAGCVNSGVKFLNSPQKLLSTSKDPVFPPRRLISQSLQILCFTLGIWVWAPLSPDCTQTSLSVRKVSDSTENLGSSGSSCKMSNCPLYPSVSSPWKWLGNHQDTHWLHDGLRFKWDLSLQLSF